MTNIHDFSLSLLCLVKIYIGIDYQILLLLGCIFSVLFLLRVTSNAMSPFWVFTLSALYGVFILMAITGLYKVSIRHQWAVFQRRTR